MRLGPKGNPKMQFKLCTSLTGSAPKTAQQLWITHIEDGLSCTTRASGIAEQSRVREKCVWSTVAYTQHTQLWALPHLDEA